MRRPAPITARWRSRWPACRASSSTPNGRDVLPRRRGRSPRRLEQIARHIEALDAEIAAVIAAADKLARRHDILDSVPKHAANSGGVFFTPRAHYDSVRPGLSLYGIDPTGRPSRTGTKK